MLTLLATPSRNRDHHLPQHWKSGGMLTVLAVTVAITCWRRTLTSMPTCASLLTGTANWPDLLCSVCCSRPAKNAWRLQLITEIIGDKKIHEFCCKPSAFLSLRIFRQAGKLSWITCEQTAGRNSRAKPVRNARKRRHLGTAIFVSLHISLSLSPNLSTVRVWVWVWVGLWVGVWVWVIRKVSATDPTLFPGHCEPRLLCLSMSPIGGR